MRSLPSTSRHLRMGFRSITVEAAGSAFHCRYLQLRFVTSQNQAGASGNLVPEIDGETTSLWRK